MTTQTRPLPGRTYLIAIGACLAVGAFVGAIWMLHGAKRLAGTDSVNPATVVANLKPGQRLCVRDLVVPSNAQTIRFQLAPGAGKPVGSPSIWSLRRPARRLISALPDGARHASLFRAGFVGPWLYGVLAVLIVAAWAGGIRLVIRGAR